MYNVIAPLAQEYVSQRLERSRAEYDKPLDVRPEVDQILVELDGSHVRTGIFQSSQTQQLTKKRQLPKKERTFVLKCLYRISGDRTSFILDRSYSLIQHSTDKLNFHRCSARTPPVMLLPAATPRSL